MRQEDCSHPKVRFGPDGDNHLTCPTEIGGCGLTWAVVNTSTEGEFVQSELSGKGVGATLSGQLRIAQT